MREYESQNKDNDNNRCLDIRDRSHITHDDVLDLNFIRNPNHFVFRRHYRQGLRSHVMEVLAPSDIALEKAGAIRDGQRFFPKALPVKALRLFRSRFSSWQEAIEDIRRFHIIKSFLTTQYLATSEEFVVDYVIQGERQVMLCGLQSFIEGHVLDPWRLAQGELIQTASPVHQSKPAEMPQADWIQSVRHHANRFVTNVRRMILETQLVPDLAGIGNLLLTQAGGLVLVDINNVCRVSWDSCLPLDEKGYPTCDKSVEALARIQAYLAETPVTAADPLYRHFLVPERMAEVTDLHRRFHRHLSV